MGLWEETAYRIECWNPKTKQYKTGWEGTSLMTAKLTYNKPYYKTQTRRLIRVYTETILFDSGKRK